MIAPSELIINPDGSCFHLHLKPEQLADKIIMVGDPDRVNTPSPPTSIRKNVKCRAVNSIPSPALIKGSASQHFHTASEPTISTSS